MALGLAVVACGYFFSAQIIPAAKVYPEYQKAYAGYYENLRNVLDEIPKDASVSAGTFNTAYLSQRDVIYDIRYASWENIRQTDYVVLKKTATDYKNFADKGQNNGYENLVAKLTEEGYEVWKTMGSTIVIYKKPVA